MFHALYLDWHQVGPSGQLKKANFDSRNIRLIHDRDLGWCFFRGVEILNAWTKAGFLKESGFLSKKYQLTENAARLLSKHREELPKNLNFLRTNKPTN